LPTTLTKTQVKQALGISSSKSLQKLCKRVGIPYRDGKMLFTPAECKKLGLSSSVNQ